jgi:Flp pilus assembly pilin Flp
MRGLTIGLRALGRRLWRRGERGAAIVEYALFVGLLLLGATAAIGGLEDDAESYYDATSNDIGDLPQSAIPTFTLPDGTPITTTTQAPTTTTGPTTTTSPPPSTTAPPPTTTTAPPPTTTIPPATVITQLLDRSTARSGGTWRARFRVTLTNSDTGDRVPAATVTGNFDGYGNRQCVTNSRGRCNMSWNVPDDDPSVLASVTAVDAAPDWDESGASILLLNPE